MSTAAIASHTLNDIRGELPRFGVKHLWLFGSRARGEEREDSDWDVLVEFAGTPSFDDFMGLKLFLEDHLGRPVDVLSRAACKPRFLAAISHELRHVACSRAVSARHHRGLRPSGRLS
jgi:predicted nucleotidyltransferase